mmetsp:Transcript_28083/g.61627  ORF Transcript_28083/g.61627 Transcript_28083/m.61627 type:complete len:456 (-) Transcript_28083:1802-3169(-)
MMLLEQEDLLEVPEVGAAAMTVPALELVLSFPTLRVLPTLITSSLPATKQIRKVMHLVWSFVLESSPRCSHSTFPLLVRLRVGVPSLTVLLRSSKSVIGPRLVRPQVLPGLRLPWDQVLLMASMKTISSLLVMKLRAWGCRALLGHLSFVGICTDSLSTSVYTIVSKPLPIHSSMRNIARRSLRRKWKPSVRAVSLLVKVPGTGLQSTLSLHRGSYPRPTMARIPNQPSLPRPSCLMIVSDRSLRTLTFKLMKRISTLSCEIQAAWLRQEGRKTMIWTAIRMVPPTMERKDPPLEIHMMRMTRFSPASREQEKVMRTTGTRKARVMLVVGAAQMMTKMRFEEKTMTKSRLWRRPLRKRREHQRLRMPRAVKTKGSKGRRISCLKPMTMVAVLVMRLASALEIRRRAVRPSVGEMRLVSHLKNGCRSKRRTQNTRVKPSLSRSRVKVQRRRLLMCP